jgi:hypothetical protein
MRRGWFIVGLLGLMCLLLTTPGWAQPSRPDGSIFTAGATIVTPSGALYSTAPPAIADGSIGLPRMDVNRNLQINCINCGGAAGGTSATDKGTFTGGSSSFTPVGGAFDDVTPSTLAEGQLGIMRLTANRAIHVNLRDATGAEITSFGGGTQYQQGTVATDTDTMMMAGCVRQDTAAIATGVIAGDRARCIVDATGRLWTHVGAIDGNVTVVGTGTFAVQSAATQSGTWTVQPGNTANTTAWLVTGTGGTFPATQSGTWSVRNQDGAGNNLTSKSAGAERAMSVAIVDGAGAQITTFGGGTQYAEGTTAATITGTALMWEDTADTLRSVSAAKPLPVNIISGAGSGGTAQADEAVFTVGTTSLTPVGGLYLSVRDSVVSGRTGALAMTPTRALITTPEGPGGEVLVDTANAAFRTSVVTVVTTQGKTQTVREWAFTASQDSSTALVTVAGGQKMRVTYAMVTCSNANTVNVEARVGFGTGTLSGVSSTTGIAGVFLSHPGIAPGSGAATNFTGAVEGGDGEDPRIVLGTPTSGSCRLTLAYEVI